ncbi:membrane-bound transcription factor site-2 protease [Pelomyxa schiedti]|nr:membrane-bound transcription factor site-2 protease [Pelomyxa schiedti]
MWIWGVLVLCLSWVVVNVIYQVRMLLLFGSYVTAHRPRSHLGNREKLRRVGWMYRWKLRTFYRIGAIVGVVAMVGSVAVLIANLVMLWRGYSRQGAIGAQQSQLLTPVTNLTYTSLSEGILIQGAGAFIAVIYPGAYVCLPDSICGEEYASSGGTETTGFSSGGSASSAQWRSSDVTISMGGTGGMTTSRTTWRVFSAGAWHNLVVSVFVCVVLIAMPCFLYPFYSSPNAAVVTSVPDSSPLMGHIFPGDEITAVEKCNVGNVREWENCLAEFTSSPGYCLPDIRVLDNFKIPSVMASECCSSHYTGNGYCFAVDSENAPTLHYCLNAHAVVSSARRTCSKHEECPSMSSACAVPIIWQNGTSLITLHLRRPWDSSISTLLFLGSPHSLFQSFKVDRYQLRWSFMPSFLLLAPHFWSTLFFHVLSISFALGLMNMAPCKFVDGEYVLAALVAVHYSATIETAKKRKVFQYILAFGTGLLVINVVLSLVMLAVN